MGILNKKVEKEPKYQEYCNGKVKWNPENNQISILEPGLYEDSLSRYLDEVMFTEEDLAKRLFDWDLPDMIEDLIIAEFNRQKKERLLRQDKINQKKAKILRSYNPLR